MFDHVTIRASDREASERFYETVVETAGSTTSGFASRTWRPRNGSTRPAFPALDNQTVDAFHRAATEAGYRDNGAPGERRRYHSGYYAAYVLDPDGHNIEVVNHNRGQDLAGT